MLKSETVWMISTSSICIATIDEEFDGSVGTFNVEWDSLVDDVFVSLVFII